MADDVPAPASGTSRRTVLAAAGLLPLASLAPALISEARADAATSASYRYFSAHQAAVVEAAAARLIPGPQDDPVEAAHDSPGAREADVVRYIDRMLSLFDGNPPTIFAGGPWSNRHTHGPDYMARFVPPAERQLYAWKIRVRQLRKQYVAAVQTLDKAAGGDFSKASTAQQDQVLTKEDAVRDLIFTNAIEGMYANPEYGGNAGLAGWKSIDWPGDTQPVGYSAAQVERYDGPDVLVATPLIDAVLGKMPAAAAYLVARGWPRG